MNLALEEQFRKARDRENLRQKFIGSIDLGNFSKYVKGVFYRKSEPFLQLFAEKVNTPVMVTEYPLFLPHPRSTIYVYPHAFRGGCSNSDDFLSLLLDHECLHAKTNYEMGWRERIKRGFPQLSLERQRKQMKEEEGPVYEYQFKMLESRECSKPFVQRVSYFRWAYSTS